MADTSAISKLIAVMDDEDLVILDKSEIFYFERMNRKTVIHTKDAFYTSKKSLTHYETILKDTEYFRAHRSIIVNLSKVDRCIPRINYTFDLSFREKNDIVPLSRDRAKILMNLLGI